MDFDLLTDPILKDAPEVEGYKVLGCCVLQSKLGQGGMGAVYQGQHVNLGIEVAVKCLLPALASMNKDLVARFQREAHLAARVTHQNLVRVYDIGEELGIHFLVMEFVRGETLRQRIERRGRSSPAEAVAILLQAARALAAAHAEGIVHRDIKPDNILLSARGSIKVADLGLGRLGEAAGGATASMVRMGTPPYMPPEQWLALGRVGPPGDVWALGATLYYLVTGENAFQGSLHEIERRICGQPFPDAAEKLPDLPEDLAGLIRRCTEEKPEDRYADAGALEEALGEVAARNGFEPRIAEPPPAEATSSLSASFRPQGATVPLPPPSVLEKVRSKAFAREKTQSAARLEVSPRPAPAMRGWVVAALGLCLGLAGLVTLAWIRQELAAMRSERQVPFEERPGAAAGPLTELASPEATRRGPGVPPEFKLQGENPQGYPEYLHAPSGIVMVLLPGGEFRMGSGDDDEDAQEDEKPPRLVELSPFLIGKYEVSQGEWRQVMGPPPAPRGDRDDELPVVNVSWYDCQEFCRKVGLELPSEAQWEYACRGMTTSIFSFGDAWKPGAANVDRLGEGPRRVRSFEPNAFGLYNLHGNAYEWCEDVYVAEGVSRGDSSRDLRVLRGGSFALGPESCRSAARHSDDPEFRDQTIGFRVAFTLSEGER
jgi:formylglycine-generating enzyme required for sulfatase activity/predicted Ser/Thr protein kinase